MDQIFDTDGAGISSTLGPGMSWKDKGNESNSMSEKINEKYYPSILTGDQITYPSSLSYKQVEEEEEEEKGRNKNEFDNDNKNLNKNLNEAIHTKKIDGNDYEIVKTDIVVNPMMIDVSVGDEDDEEEEEERMTV